MKNNIKYISIGVILFLIIGFISFGFYNSYLKKESKSDQTSKQTKIEKSLLDDVKKNNFKLKGNKNAKNTIIVFADAQCPDCEIFHNKIFKPHIEKMIKSGDVKYAEIDYQVINHSSQLYANMFKAIDSESTSNNYWKFKDLAYNNIKVKDPVDLLNKTNFKNKDKIIKKYNTIKNEKIDNSIGEKYKVNATPTIFVNGKSVDNYKEMKKQLKAGN